MKIRKYLTSDQIEGAFSLSRQLRNVDAIFARVFGSDPISVQSR